MVSSQRTFRDGLIVGLIASVSVAVFYALFDFLAARGTLFTVDLLGKAVFMGLRDPAVLQLPITPDRQVILWYNLMHLAISLAIGLVVTWLADQSERDPAKSPLILFVIVGGFVVTIIAVGLLTGPIRPLLPWYTIVLANGFAVLFAGFYLLRARPGIFGRLVLLRKSS